MPDYSCHLGIMYERRNALVWEDGIFLQEPTQDQNDLFLYA